MSKLALFILGFMSCGLAITITFFAINKTSQANGFIDVEKQTLSLLHRDSSQKNNSVEFTNLNTKQLNLEEKIVSTNKRFDDLYVLGGIIITLLIAINIGIFITVDNRVDKYFKEHFDEHEKNIVKCEKEAGALLGKIRLYHGSLPNNQQNTEQQT